MEEDRQCEEDRVGEARERQEGSRRARPKDVDKKSQMKV
jgi:hypothetical protein